MSNRSMRTCHSRGSTGAPAALKEGATHRSGVGKRRKCLRMLRMTCPRSLAVLLSALAFFPPHAAAADRDRAVEPQEGAEIIVKGIERDGDLACYASTGAGEFTIEIRRKGDAAP